MMLLDLGAGGVRCHQGTQTGLDHPDTRNEITGWWFEGQNAALPPTQVGGTALSAYMPATLFVAIQSDT